MRMYTRAPDLDHVVAQVREARKVELLFRVVTAGRACGARRQDAVGADHFRSLNVAHQKMFAMYVKAVTVGVLARGLEPGAHFFGEHRVAQALRLGHFRFVARKAHRQPAFFCDSRPLLLFQHGAPPDTQLSWRNCRKPP